MSAVPHVLDALAVVALVSGALTWVWIGDARWAATGLGVSVVLVVLAATLTARAAARRRDRGERP
ncbi:hypothetical protein [Kutzneria chonburiensis]|uniref:Uncharacterized protein n=1 Tax=Kutzneria chonburiensis TaxID=1483604 RepID=A0ABV6N4I5_9PSEU|nr:hypothetical protein [Kutzneria chonburiensis]